MTPPARPALFLIAKPIGPTSHDIVQQLRRWTEIRRVGHGGTLDPLATGLLPVFIGSATRLIEYLAEHRKSYTATIRLGVSTDTDDAQGAVIREAPVPALERAEMDAALEPFRGEGEQVPPDYSAVKVGGVSAHRAARRGTPLQMAARSVAVYALTLESWAAPDLRIALTVSGGTYVRALARDLGEALGCGAHVIAMSRTRIGPVSVDEAQPLDALEAAFAEGRGWDLAVPPDRFLEHWPHPLINDTQYRLLLNGQPVPMTARDRGAAHALAVDRHGLPVAVLVPEQGWPERWRPVKVLARRRAEAAG